VAHLGEAHLRERLMGARKQLARWVPFALPDREQDVLEHGRRVEERAALEDHPEALADAVEGAAAEARDVLAADQDTPAVGVDQSQEMPEEHRLAASRASDDDHQLGRRHLEVDAAEDLLGPEALPEPFHPDGRGAGGHGSTDPRT
jgi:hypothetical protein